MAKTSHKIRIKAPQDRIFQAITTAEGLKGWYTPQVEGEVRKGGEAIFRFTSREPFRWKFVELTPNSRARWECVEGPGAAKGTSVTSRLTDSGDGRTVVECDHEGWPEAHEALATCNTFWGILLGHLQKYAETSVVTPEGFRGPFFKQNSGPKPRQEARWSHHRNVHTRPGLPLDTDVGTGHFVERRIRKCPISSSMFRTTTQSRSSAIWPGDWAINSPASCRRRPTW
jgi:uncharacterized protein YndB with AHSA1/START domain